MKLYEYEAFPSPRRVRMFLEQVDVPAGEQNASADMWQNRVEHSLVKARLLTFIKQGYSHANPL